MSGRGAYLFGGRWNAPEHHAVYLSGTLTLAMLERLVHLDNTEAFVKKKHVYHAVHFDEKDVAVLEKASSFAPSSMERAPGDASEPGAG